MQSLFSELKRRKVYHAAAFYAAAAWLLVQIATQVFPFFDLPAGWIRLIIIGAVLGFPLAITISWFYEWTPSGFRRESDDERTENIARIISQALDKRGLAPHSLSLPSLPSSFEQSIAVLPFADMSEARDHEYFSDGLAEEVLNLLAQLPQLRVVARTSSFAFKGKDADVPAIASALKVANVLTGSVRRSGRKLRVGAQLIRAADSALLWSHAFESELTDVFALQDTIARAVVAAMRVKLLRSQRLANPHRTGNAARVEADQVERVEAECRRDRRTGHRDGIEAGAAGTAGVEQHRSLSVAAGRDTDQGEVDRVAVRLVVVERHRQCGAFEDRVLDLRVRAMTPVERAWN